jgi:hypothetical protein
MWLKQLCTRLLGQPATCGGPRLGARRLSRRPRLEQLEARELPASYTAASVPDLIADINASNQAGGANTITLTASITLTAADNLTDGANGLPVIAANDNLSIAGNSNFIARSTATGTPFFRLFDVAAGAALTLQNLTLQGGDVLGTGGAILNQGALTMNSVTVQNNIAAGFGDAAGGGIWSGGASSSLTLTSCTIQNNSALGGPGHPAGVDRRTGQAFPASPGGNAFGGGLYLGGGTAQLNNVTLTLNQAVGGDGGRGNRFSTKGANGGNGFGGGVYTAGGTASLIGCTVTSNAANGGAGGKGGNSSPGVGEGGGLYIDALAAVSLDTFTKNNVMNNTASTNGSGAGRNISGQYTLI